MLFRVRTLNALTGTLNLLTALDDERILDVSERL